MSLSKHPVQPVEIVIDSDGHECICFKIHVLRLIAVVLLVALSVYGYRLERQKRFLRAERGNAIE